MPYVLKYKGLYVSKSHQRAYTPYREQAQEFLTRDDAQLGKLGVEEIAYSPDPTPLSRESVQRLKNAGYL